MTAVDQPGFGIRVQRNKSLYPICTWCQASTAICTILEICSCISIKCVEKIEDIHPVTKRGLSIVRFVTFFIVSQFGPLNHGFFLCRLLEPNNRKAVMTVHRS